MKATCDKYFENELTKKIDIVRKVLDFVVSQPMSNFETSYIEKCYDTDSSGAIDIVDAVNLLHLLY